MDDTKQQPESGQSNTSARIQPKMIKHRFVSSSHKEMGPSLSVRSVEAPVAEYIDTHGSEKIPELPEQLEQSGVEVVEKERPQLTAEQQGFVQHAKESVPVVPQTQSVQLPYTPVQIKEMKKETPKEGKHWLAVFVEYLGKKLVLQ